MNQKAWDSFQKTGSIDDYMAFKGLQNATSTPAKPGKKKAEGDHANNARRPDSPRTIG